jgi:carbon monoxide dehydrogenase subunit G
MTQDRTEKTSTPPTTANDHGKRTTRFTVDVPIQATPARVWAVLREIERWPEWTPTVAKIEPVGSRAFEVGARVKIHQPKLLPATWQITEVDEGRAFTWVMRGLGVRVSGRHEVRAGERGSHATLSLEFSGFLGPLVARIYGRLNERYLAMEAAGLRERCEKSEAV